MKHILYIALAAASAIGLASCDDIKESDRFVELPPVGTTSRVVLLEEFTGQYCPNCPDAHKIVARLSEQFPDNFIAVAIHGGDLAIPVEDGGLATDDGYAYASHWNVTSYPSGILNRATAPMARTEWAANLRAMLEQPTWLKIDVTATLDDNEENILITTELTPEMTANAKLQLWVLEDEIYGFQSDSEASLPMYRHDHVYRASVNGLWGEEVALVEGETTTLSHSIAVSEEDDFEWDADYLSVVAFVYNEQGVVQAAKVAVAKSN